jgi:hypothetical protein
MPLGTSHAAPIKCKQRHQPLTSLPHGTETAVYTGVRNYYGAATEGPRRPITSAPTSRTMPA